MFGFKVSVSRSAKSSEEWSDRRPVSGKSQMMVFIHRMNIFLREGRGGMMFGQLRLQDGVLVYACLWLKTVSPVKRC